jgi:hypothetical protein
MTNINQLRKTVACLTTINNFSTFQMLYPPLKGEKTMLFKHILVSKARRGSATVLFICGVLVVLGLN